MDLTVLEAFGLGGLLWFPFPGLTRLNLRCQLAWALTGGAGEESASRISQFVGNIQFILVVSGSLLLAGCYWEPLCFLRPPAFLVMFPPPASNPPRSDQVLLMLHFFLYLISSWAGESSLLSGLMGLDWAHLEKSKLIYFKVFNFNHICKASFAM